MKSLFFSLLLFFPGAVVYCTTWTITNSGFSFSPATITITLGDDVNFDLDNIHNAVEVSQTTWAANGNSPLSGGFQTPFGGGQVNASQLGIGTHYYVCSPHASGGMKGTIIVQTATGIADNPKQMIISVYPNPSHSLMTVKTNNTLTDSRFFITDQSGRKVSSGRLEDETTLVNISHLATGVYFLQVVGQRGHLVKVIKN